MVGAQVCQVWRAVVSQSAEAAQRGPYAEYYNWDLGRDTFNPAMDIQYRLGPGPAQQQLVDWVERMRQPPAAILIFDPCGIPTIAQMLTPALSILPRSTRVVLCSAGALTGDGPQDEHSRSVIQPLRCCALFDGAAALWSAAGRCGAALRHTVACVDDVPGVDGDAVCPRSYDKLDVVLRQGRPRQELGPLQGMIAFMRPDTDAEPSGEHGQRGFDDVREGLEGVQAMLAERYPRCGVVAGGLCDSVTAWRGAWRGDAVSATPALAPTFEGSPNGGGQWTGVPATAGKECWLVLLGVWGTRAVMEAHQFGGEEAADAGRQPGLAEFLSRLRPTPPVAPNTTPGYISCGYIASPPAAAVPPEPGLPQVPPPSPWPVAENLPVLAFPCIGRAELQIKEEGNFHRHCQRRRMLGYYCDGEVCFGPHRHGHTPQREHAPQAMWMYTTVWAAWGERRRPLAGPEPPDGAYVDSEGRTRLPDPAWPAGAEVRVHGLTSPAGQEFNGELGVLTGREGNAGRLLVRFDDGGVKALRRENLRREVRRGPHSRGTV